MKLINVGFGNLVSAERIVAIAGFESQPLKRLTQDARSEGRLIDTTYGRKTKSVIMMDSGHIVTSALAPETISGRIAEAAEEKDA